MYPYYRKHIEDSGKELLEKIGGIVLIICFDCFLLDLSSEGVRWQR
jgi:hypothetical protein